VHLLKDFMEPSVEMLANLSSIDISLLVKSHRDFSWICVFFMG
jgi:hypothetical protein